MNRLILNKIDYIVLFSAFLPYLIINKGIRIEHLVVYLLFLILLLKGSLFNFKKNSSLTVIFLFILISYVVVISSLVNDLPLDRSFLSNFENYIETIVLFLIFNSLLAKKKFFTKDRMLGINTFFHFLLAINTCIILLEIFTPFADYFLRFYVDNDLEGYSRNATNSMGRYMGVFNQPLESGFAYSLGLLTWVYNFTNKGGISKLLQIILLLLILIGGLASVSKVFIFGGLIISSILFFVQLKNKTTLLFLIIGLISFYFVTPFLIKDWQGYSYLEEKIIGITSELSVRSITAGRIGSETGIYSAVGKKDISLFYGQGFTLGDLPYFDSEYIQIIYQGGGIALIMYLLMIIKNFRTCFFLSNRFSKEKIFLFAILVLGLFTALGGPVFLMNRVRIFFFLQLFFLYKLSQVRFFKKRRMKSSIINETSTAY